MKKIKSLREEKHKCDRCKFIKSLIASGVNEESKYIQLSMKNKEFKECWDNNIIALNGSRDITFANILAISFVSFVSFVGVYLFFASTHEILKLFGILPIV